MSYKNATQFDRVNVSEGIIKVIIKQVNEKSVCFVIIGILKIEQ